MTSGCDTPHAQQLSFSSKHLFTAEGQPASRDQSSVKVLKHAVVRCQWHLSMVSGKKSCFTPGQTACDSCRGGAYVIRGSRFATSGDNPDGLEERFTRLEERSTQLSQCPAPAETSVCCPLPSRFFCLSIATV